MNDGSHPSSGVREPAWPVIDRYLAGDAADDEQVMIERWLARDPAARAEIESLRTVFLREVSADRHAFTDLAARAEVMLGRRARGEARVPTAGLVGFHRDVGRPRFGNAGVAGRRGGAEARAVRGSTGLGRRSLWPGIALATILGVVLVARSHVTPTSTTSSALPAQTYTTAAGEQATMVLRDGSRAVLGPATTVSVTGDPAHAGTTVTVTGQALFSVAHRRQTPFMVRAGNSVTRVLGTTFLVRRYDTDRTTRVVVMEGRVSVQNLLRSLKTDAVLTAGTLGIVDDSGQVRVIPNVGVEDYTAWATGQLVFRQTPVRDIVVELGRAYGIDIRLADSTLAARSLTWTVPVMKKSAVATLETLAALLGAHVTQSGVVITIVPGAFTSRKPVDVHKPYSSESQYGR